MSNKIRTSIRILPTFAFSLVQDHRSPAQIAHEYAFTHQQVLDMDHFWDFGGFLRTCLLSLGFRLFLQVVWEWILGHFFFPFLLREAKDRKRRILKRRMQKRAWEATTTNGVMVIACKLGPPKLTIIPPSLLLISLQIFLCKNLLEIFICVHS